MRRLNVLHAITKLELGGAQQLVLETIRRLPREEFNSILVSSEGLLAEAAQDLEDAKVVLIPQLRRQISPLLDLIALIRLFRLCRGVDIVHTHSSKAGVLGRWAAKLAGVPIIIHTIHGWGFHDYQNPLVKRLFIFLERFTAKITNRLVAVSEANVEKGLTAGIAKASKYVVIPGGIRVDEFSRVTVDIREKKRELGLDSNCPVVGMIACLKPQKAPDDFVRAAARVVKSVPEAKFLLIGDGLLRPKVERLIDQLNLSGSVRLTGWRRDIPQVLKVLDVLVLTSLYEGLPLVFPQAMAAGLPVVATRVDGASEAIGEGQTGFLVPPKDLDTLAQRIITLLNDRDLARRMGEEGRRSVDPRFNIEVMVQKVGQLYRELAKEKGL